MQVLTEHIRKWHRENDRKPEDDAGAIHPSSLGACNRRTIYKFLGVPRDLEFSPYKKAIFYHGYAIEDWMNKALEAKGMLIAHSVPVQAEFDGIPVRGLIDHIVKWKDGWCIADTKSVSDHAFKYQSFPYEHHCLQVGCYQWALGEMLGLDRQTRLRRLAEMIKDDYHHFSELDDALFALAHGKFGEQYPPLLFYVGRGNLKELPPVTAGDNAIYLALEKLEEVSRYIKSKTYPPRPFESPEEHPYLCASCVRKGYKRKDGTYSTDPLYKPNCEWFRHCWHVLPVEWSFWYEVAGREEIAF